MISWRRRSHDESGAVLVFVAIAMVVMIGSTALAVDIGQLTNNNRSLQAVADVIALDAARAMNGETVSQLSAPTGAVTVAAQASASRNNFPYATLTVDLGTATGGNFVRQDPAVTPNAVPTAARVTAAATVNFAFAHGSRTTNRSATAVQQSITGISVGSFLARVSTSTGLLNSVLGGFLGANLTLVGYTGIAAGSVNLGELQAQLGIDTVDALLTTNVSVKNFLNATAAALLVRNDSTSLTARTGVLSLASATNASLTFKLGDLISIPQGAGSAAAAADINVLQLIEMAAQVANGTNALSVTLSPSSLGGLGGLLNAGGNALSLKVIEAPKIVIGPAAQDAGGNWVTTVHTAQVRLMIHLRPLGTVLGGLLDLPIYIEAASATASVRGITCATPADNSTVNVHTDTQALRVRVGAINDINAANPILTDATILNVLGLARVTARADAGLASSSSDLVFHGPFDWSNTQTVGSSSLGLGSLIQSDPLVLNLHVLGLGLGLGGVLSSVLALLNPILSVVDNGLLDPLLSGLGISLGGGDITNFMLNCNGLKLVG